MKKKEKCSTICRTKDKVKLSWRLKKNFCPVVREDFFDYFFLSEPARLKG